MAYRQRHAALTVPGVLDLALNDTGNPRSLAHQLAKAQRHLQKLPRDGEVPEEALFAEALAKLDQKPLDAATLASVQGSVLEAANLVSRRFFTHLATLAVGGEFTGQDAPPP